MPKPKEFKELLNAIIGIDKLDVASESMKTVNKEFRQDIREKIGYDDTHIEILSRDLEKFQKEIEESTPHKNQLQLKQEQLQNEVEDLKKKVEDRSSKNR